MGIPKKAVRESDLRIITTGPAVSGGTHDILRVTFDDRGIEKAAFYKKVSPNDNYPELLAKMEVATAAFIRVFLGDHCADERLVFNDSEELVGILSIEIEGFTPLSFCNEKIPSDPDRRVLAIPTTEMLIDYNVNEILLASLYVMDDDVHPKNMGFAGDHMARIDFDMAWYWITIYMKDPRPFVGVTNLDANFTFEDFKQFPCDPSTRPFHWPTYLYGGEESLYGADYLPSTFMRIGIRKSYPNPSAFINLAADPRAHEQKLAAAIKALLTYQPDMVRNRLIELFGEMTLNYSSLNEDLVNGYETFYPEFFNKDSDRQSFVTFMMKIYQIHYDKLYRVVIFYMGFDPNKKNENENENKYGVPLLPATSSALFYKPSYYNDIKKWVLKQNETLLSNDDESVKYNIIELEKRYHQIWRDAFALHFKEMFEQFYNLIVALSDKVTNIRLVSIKDEQPKDEQITHVWQQFESIHKISKEDIQNSFINDPSSNYRSALISLVTFYNDFYDILKGYYYEKQAVDLTKKDNQRFVNRIDDLITLYRDSIRDDLFFETSYAQTFLQIVKELRFLSEQVNFGNHLFACETQNETSIKPAQVLLPLTHREVLAEVNYSLFNWAKTLMPGEFSRKINSIIDRYYLPNYVPSFLKGYVYNRNRGDVVKEYLRTSVQVPGDKRLAYILSSGTVDTGELNMLLIKYLTSDMLQFYPIPSLSKAIREGTFDEQLIRLTAEVVKFAKNDIEEITLYNAKGIQLFFETMFNWVDNVSKEKFATIVQCASAERKLQSSMFNFSEPRVLKALDYTKRDTGNAKALAMVFLTGGDHSLTNSILFDKIINAIKIDIKSDKNKLELPGYKLISRYNQKNDKQIYLDNLVANATARSHQQEILSKRAIQAPISQGKAIGYS